MRVFLDFEASSLHKDSYPIEVAWVFEDGRSESHLIRPAPGWTDWAATAEAIHKITRDRLFAEGRAHDVVARRMTDVLGGHDLFASAPSWDGKWLSVLLRAADLPRHALRLRDSDQAQVETILEVLKGAVPDGEAEAVVRRIAAALGAMERPAPEHRALGDARQEFERWRAAREIALQERQRLQPG